MVRGGVTAERLLLVDDSLDEREMYAEYFRAKGYCTLQAANARDGYRMAADLAPAVVIVDVKLAGDEDGLGLTARLKRDSDTRRAAVIVLTACAFESDRQAAVQAGCDRFITKPCTPDALEAAVNALIRQRASTPGAPPTLRDRLTV